MDKFENCYHEDLILEKEDIDDDDFFIFLEGDLHINKFGYIYMRYKNKNWKMLYAMGTQKIKRYVHWNSYTCKRIKCSILMGAISRIVVHSTCHGLLMHSLLKLFLELNALSYPWSFFLMILWKMRRKRYDMDKLWSDMIHIVHLIMKIYAVK